MERLCAITGETAHEPPAAPMCPTCKGCGAVAMGKPVGLPGYVPCPTTTRCPDCHGSGKQSPPDCDETGEEGTVSIGDVIAVTRANRVKLEDALVSLRENRDKLTAYTAGYPLICEFAGYRFVFENGAEIDGLIAELSKKLQPEPPAADAGAGSEGEQ